MVGQRRQTARKALTNRSKFPIATAPVQFAQHNRRLGHPGGVQSETGNAAPVLAVAQFQPHPTQRRERRAAPRVQCQRNSDLFNRNRQSREAHGEAPAIRLKLETAVSAKALASSVQESSAGSQLSSSSICWRPGVCWLRERF